MLFLLIIIKDLLCVKELYFLLSAFVFPKIHSLMITIGSPSPKGNSATPPTKQVVGERCFRSDLTQGSVGKGSEGEKGNLFSIIGF